MAFTEVTYTQTGSSNKDFTVTFPFIKSTDVYVELGGVTKTSPTHYTLAGTTITFQDGILGAGSNTIRIYRNTNIDKAKATYQTGSSIRAQDLNDNTEQILYSLQERTAQSNATPSTSGLALTAGSKNHITVNSANDWTISGTGIINSTMLASDSVDSAELVNGSVDLAHMSADSVGTNQYVDDSIENAHLKANSVDSNQYVDGSIDTAHIGDDQVTYAKMQDISTANRVLGRASAGEIQEVQVTTDMIADGAVTTAKLAAGTPIGTVIWYAGSTAPTGYLKANGDAIANGSGTTQGITTDFSALYAVVGANLPDLRGEFIRGFDDSRGVDDGRNIRSSQGDLFKNHGHKFGADDQVQAQGGYQSLGTFAYDATSTNSGTAHHCLTLNAGGDHNGGSETRPRNVCLLACIKY